MFVANYSWHCEAFQDMDDSYASSIRPAANCHHCYLSLIIRTVICHTHGTDQMCLALWSYWFLCFFLFNCCTGFVIDTQVPAVESYTPTLQCEPHSTPSKTSARSRSGGTSCLSSRNDKGDRFGGHKAHAKPCEGWYILFTCSWWVQHLVACIMLFNCTLCIHLVIVV
jgi:hypothetical protein